MLKIIVSEVKQDFENSASTAKEMSRNIDSIKIIEDCEAFTILDWANLQTRFKDHYYLIRAGLLFAIETSSNLSM